VVVEGIETEEQLEAVRSLGAERAQGFLFGKAEPIETITPQLRKAA
jgi:EAL domain-containing protein (putative c-di-GMP-specific phosphodiesterase class I)